MIESMKKVSVVLLNKEKEEALKALRKIGLVHLQKLEGSSEKLNAFKEYTNNAVVSESILGEIKLPKNSRKAKAELSDSRVIELCADVVAKSEILDSVINPKFKNNLIADYVRNNDIKEVNDYIEARKKKDPKYDKERLINDILDNNKVIFYDELEETSNKVSDSLLAEDLNEYGVDISYISKEGLDESRKEYKKSKPTVSQYIFNILPSSVRGDINKRLK